MLRFKNKKFRNMASYPGTAQQLNQQQYNISPALLTSYSIKNARKKKNQRRVSQRHLGKIDFPKNETCAIFCNLQKGKEIPPQKEFNQHFHQSIH